MPLALLWVSSQKLGIFHSLIACLKDLCDFTPPSAFPTSKVTLDGLGSRTGGYLKIKQIAIFLSCTCVNLNKFYTKINEILEMSN